MQAIRKDMYVQNDSVLEIHSSLLKPGANVEVIVLLKNEPSQVKSGLSALLGTGKGCYSSTKEADAFIRKQRDQWE